MEEILAGRAFGGGIRWGSSEKRWRSNWELGCAVGTGLTTRSIPEISITSQLIVSGKAGALACISRCLAAALPSPSSASIASPLLLAGKADVSHLSPH